MSFFDITLPSGRMPLSVIELSGIRNGQRLRVNGDVAQRELFLICNRQITGPFTAGDKAEVDISRWSAYCGRRAQLLVVDRGAVTGNVEFNDTFTLTLGGRHVPAHVTASVQFLLSVDSSKDLAMAFARCEISDPVSEAERAVFDNAKSEIRRAFRDFVSSAEPLDEMNLDEMNWVQDTIEQSLRCCNISVPGCRISNICLNLGIANWDEILESANRRADWIEQKRDMLFEALIANYRSASAVPQYIVQMVTAYLTANPGASSDEIAKFIEQMEKLSALYGPEAVRAELSSQLSRAQLGPGHRW